MDVALAKNALLFFLMLLVVGCQTCLFYIIMNMRTFTNEHKMSQNL